MQKQYVLAVRVDKETYEYIHKLCQEGGISISECLRKIVAAAQKNQSIPIISQDSYRLNKEMIREVNKIGMNINQIVKHANIGFYTEHEKKKLFALMGRILELVTG